MSSECPRSPDSRPVRHFCPPETLRQRLFYWRFGLARRLVQLAVLGGFIATARLGWSLWGQPVLSGDLSSSLLLGTVALTDPFALAQKLAAGHPLELAMLVGAVTVILFYLLVGGRSFCAWVCPMNAVTDAAEALRSRWGLRADALRLAPWVRHALALGCLLASAVSGSAAFEWINPQAFVWREAVWGIGWGSVSAVLGIFALDLLVVRRGWCSHLCPAGAFWSWIGRFSRLRPRFDNNRCTRCGDCLGVCPEPQVIHFGRLREQGFVTDGACLNCGRCIAVCPENALQFGWRVRPPVSTNNPPSS